MPATTQPTVDRPGIPREYGTAKGPKGMLSWEDVEEQLAAAKLFWVVTASSDGRPRVRPVDGTWFEGRIYVGGSTETAWVRDLLANPNVAVHLDSTDGIVILDGVAESGGGGISGDAAERLADRQERLGYGRPKAEDFAAPGSIAVRPRVIVAWRNFGKDATRFRFG